MGFVKKCLSVRRGVDWEDRSCTAPLHPAANTAAMGSCCMSSRAQQSWKNSTFAVPHHRAAPRLMAHGLPAGSLCLLLRGLLIGCGGKARCLVGRWTAVLLQGSAHSAWRELGTWREAVSGIESEHGVMGREPLVPVEGVEAWLCSTVHTTEWFQLF